MRYVLFLAILGNIWFLLLGAYVGVTETFDYTFWTQLLRIGEETVAEESMIVEPLETQDSLAPTQGSVRPWNGKSDSSQVLKVVGQMMHQVKAERDPWKRVIADIRDSEATADPKELTKLVKKFPKAPRQLKKLYQDVQVKCDSKLIDREPTSEDEIPLEITNCKASLKTFERALTEFFKS